MHNMSYWALQSWLRDVFFVVINYFIDLIKRKKNVLLMCHSVYVTCRIAKKGEIVITVRDKSIHCKLCIYIQSYKD